MKIRKNKSGQEIKISVKDTKIRNLERRGLRRTGRAGKGAISAGRAVYHAGTIYNARRIVKNEEFHIQCYLQEERAWLEESAIAGLDKNQRKAWDALSPKEQQHLLDQVVKKTERKMVRHFKNMKIRNSTSKGAGKETEKYRTADAREKQVNHAGVSVAQMGRTSNRVRNSVKISLEESKIAGDVQVPVIKPRSPLKSMMLQKQGTVRLRSVPAQKRVMISENQQINQIRIRVNRNSNTIGKKSGFRYKDIRTDSIYSLHDIENRKKILIEKKQVSGVNLPKRVRTLVVAEPDRIPFLKNTHQDIRDWKNVPVPITLKAAVGIQLERRLPGSSTQTRQIWSTLLSGRDQVVRTKSVNTAPRIKGGKVSSDGVRVPEDIFIPVTVSVSKYIAGTHLQVQNQMLRKTSGMRKPTEESHSKTAEKEYNRQFVRKLKQLRKQHRKEFRKEFQYQFAMMISRAERKTEAQRQAEKEMTVAQYQERQLRDTAGLVLLPVRVFLKVKTRQVISAVLAKLAAAAAMLVSAVVSLLMPFAGITAALALVIGLVFGILSFLADDSSAGLPDAGYVKQEAVLWAEYIAGQDEKHGYNDGLFSRWGPDDYSNCTFVVTAFDRTGLETKRAGARKMARMYDAFLDYGFADITDQVSLSDGKGLEAGDVLLKVEHRTADCRAEIVDGKGYMTGAVCDERGRQKGGETGDQTGQEIRREKYQDLGWTYVLRYYGDMSLYGGLGQELAAFACSFVGKFPYVYGGTSLETGCDCSGFVQAVYAHFGYSIPRTAGNIYLYSRKLSSDMSTWQPGDIIYYSSTGYVQTGGGKEEHIGIYLGDGKVVQCGRGGVSVKDNYNYNGHFCGAGRILPDFDGAANLTGNNNAQKIWNYLRKTLGCSRAAAAGILGNIYGEDTIFDPKLVEPNGVGHGICQWSWDRWYGSNGLEAYARKNGRPWDDLALQLSFLRYEIENHIVGGVDYCIPGGFEKYRRMTQVSGSGGTVHLWFNAFEYNGGTFSYDWLMTEGEKNWAFQSHRLTFAMSCYEDAANYP